MEILKFGLKNFVVKLLFKEEGADILCKYFDAVNVNDSEFD